jgi:hypothetical protein
MPHSPSSILKFITWPHVQVLSVFMALFSSWRYYHFIIYFSVGLIPIPKIRADYYWLLHVSFCWIDPHSLARIILLDYML